MKKDKILILLFVIILLLNIILRIPMVPSEIGVDSYLLHGLAQSIIDNGFMKWILTPFSLAGLYPYSYASGVPIILSEVSLLTGLPMEYTVLAMSIMVGIISVFTSYLLARKITGKKDYALIASIIFSISTGMLFFTTWTASGRAMFLVLTPVFIYSLISFEEKKSIKYLLFTIILFLLMMLIHRMYIFLIVITIAFYFAILLNYLYSRFKFFERNLKWIFLAGLLILPPSLWVFNMFTGYLKGHVYTNIPQMVLEYGRSINIHFIVFSIGMLYLILKRNKTKMEIIITTIMIAFSPLLTFEVYGMTFMLTLFPFIAIFGIIFLTRTKIKFKSTIISALLFAAIFFSALLQNWHPDLLDQNTQYDTYMAPSDKSMANWLKGYDGRIVTMSDPINSRLNSVLPCRIYYGDVIPLVCDYITIDYINENKQSELKISSVRTPITLKREFRYDLGNYIHYYAYDQPYDHSVIDEDSIKYYISYRRVFDADREFVKTLKKDKDRIFDNSRAQVWSLN